VREIRAAGIRAKGLVMMGLPGENEASIARSKQYVMSLPLNEFNLAKFTPFPGSPLYDQVRDLGTFDEDWERMDCMHFLFVPKGMTREQLERLYADFYRTHTRGCGSLGLLRHAVAVAPQLVAFRQELGGPGSSAPAAA
jgi:radical SAM superfamily enzyme YgiQ (UPF0313 family)